MIELKKRLLIPTIIVVLGIVFLAFKYFIPNKVTEVNNKEYVTNQISLNTKDIKTSNKASLLMNLDTNQVLYQENIQQSIPVYSVSKVMFLATASKKLAEDKRSMDGVITVTKLIDKVNSKANFSKANLKSGQKFTIKELYEAVMMPSGNDAAILLADNIFGNQANAVNAMNANAKEWGMNNSSFISTSGLDGKYLKEIGVEATEGKNLMSPYDLVLLVKKVYKDYPIIIEAGTKTKTTIGKANKNPIKLENVNGVIEGNDNGIKNVMGLKTGSNIEKGSNAIVALRKTDDSNAMLAISLASQSRLSLYEDIENMYKYVDSLEAINMQEQIKLNSKVGFVKNEVGFGLSKPYYLYAQKGQGFQFSVEDLKHYNANLNRFYVKDKGEEIGQLSILETDQFFNKEPINQPKVVVATQPERKNIFAQGIEFINDIITK